MNILALETSTDACSVALWLEGEIACRYEEQPRRHVELLLPMVRGLLAEADIPLGSLDGIAFGAGPGSFTGVRIAASAAQGLALGAGLPVVGVSSLAALALAAADAGAERVLVAQDARMGEVYVGRYEADEGAVTPLCADSLLAPEAVCPDGSWTLAGDAWTRYPALGAGANGSRVVSGLLLPRAAEVARLSVPRFAAGESVAPRDAAPAYLRKSVAQRAS